MNSYVVTYVKERANCASDRVIASVATLQRELKLLQLEDAIFIMSRYDRELVTQPLAETRDDEIIL